MTLDNACSSSRAIVELVTEEQRDREAWAREHATVLWTPVGRSASRYLEQIKVDGLVFEGRAEDETRRSRSNEQRAVEDAIAAYLDFVERSGGAR